MKQLIIAAVIAATFTALVSSCQKDGTKAEPEVTPTASITIASPTANQVYRLGDTMHIVATVEGNVKLHGYDVAIVNTSSGDTIYKADGHAHETTLTVDEHWCCTLSSAADLRLYISSALNHDGLEVVKAIDFTVAP